MTRRSPASRSAYAAFLLFAVALTIIGPSVPRLAAEFHAGLGRVGILFTVNFIGFCLALLLGLALTGRVARSRIFVCSGIGLGLALMLFGLVPGLSAAMAAILFVGGFGGLVESLGSAVVADLNPGRTGRALNLAQVFFAAGALAGPTLAGYLLGRGYSWRLMYLGTGGITLAVFLGLLATPLPAVEEERFAPRTLGRLLGNWWFLGSLLLMAAYVGVEIGLWGWLSAFVEGSLDFTAWQSGLAVGVFWLAMGAGRVACSRLSEHLAAPLIILGLLAVSLAATVLLALPVAPALVWLLIVLVGLGLSGIWPTILAYGGAPYPRERAAVFNLIVGSGGVGGMILPALVGGIAEARGFQAGLFLLAGVQVLMVLLTLALRRRVPG